MLYAAVGLPLAVAGFGCVVVSSALGVVLAVTFVGLPLLALSGAGALRIGQVHRRLVQRLLGETIPAPVRAERGSGLFGRLQMALTDPATWRARAYLVLKLPLAVVSFYALFIGWFEGIVGVIYPLIWASSGPGETNHQPLLDIAALVGRAGRRLRPPDRPRLDRATWLVARRYLAPGVADHWRQLGADRRRIVGLRGLARVDQRLVGALLGPSQSA